MQTRFIRTAAAMVLAAGSAVSAQSLSTGFTGTTFVNEIDPNCGNMFDVTVFNPGGITVNSFEVHSSAPLGTPITVEIYTKTGSWVGSSSTAANWTLLGSAPAVSGGSFNPTAVAIGGLNIGANETVGIYVNIVEAGASVQYFPLALLPSINPVNNDLRIGVNYGQAKSGLFGTTNFTPRGWNGTIYYTAHGVSATGACCLADASCIVAGMGGCEGQGGVYRGDNTACGAITCTIFHNEVEDNSRKDDANALVLPAGQSIRGVSNGTITTTGDVNSVDYFRIKTEAATLGIYQHRMVLNSELNGHSAWIRGLTQTGAAAGPWPGPVGTATATESAAQSHQLSGDDRINMWYGFGKEEEVFYRVAGTTSSATNQGTWMPYMAMLETAPVMPTDLGSFAAGQIDITTTGQGHTNDTHLRIFDADLNPIHGYANDGASINGGAPANLTTTSFLRREYNGGTYYMAIALTNLATNQGSPCDDNVRTGPMMDFPNVAVDTGTLTATDVSFAVVDAMGTTPFVASRGGRGEIAWFRFTVTGTIQTGACCFEDGTCTGEMTVNACVALGGTYAGDDVTCAAAECPQPGACCMPFGCIVRSQTQCATMGGAYQGNGTECGVSTCPPPSVGNIIGFNFATSAQTASPQNWTLISSATTVTNVTDDTGAPTTVGLTLSAPGTISFIGNSAIGATATPQYIYDLSSMNGYAFRSSAGPLTVEVFGLEPDRTYEYWYVAHRASLAVNNIVQVSHGDVPNAISFNQTHTGSWFSVNPTVANNTMDFNTLSQSTLSSSTGTITFNVAASTDTTTLAALAIREVFPTTPPCYPNCDGSTTEPILNVADFSCFLGKFAAGDPYANCDGSTIEPVLNVADFSCFLGKFAAGCR
jgi:hypothetical protein